MLAEDIFSPQAQLTRRDADTSQLNALWNANEEFAASMQVLSSLQNGAFEFKSETSVAPALETIDPRPSYQSPSLVKTVRLIRGGAPREISFHMNMEEKFHCVEDSEPKNCTTVLAAESMLIHWISDLNRENPDLGILDFYQLSLTRFHRATNVPPQGRYATIVKTI